MNEMTIIGLGLLSLAVAVTILSIQVHILKKRFDEEELSNIRARGDSRDRDQDLMNEIQQLAKATGCVWKGSTRAGWVKGEEQ